MYFVKCLQRNTRSSKFKMSTFKFFAIIAVVVICFTGSVYSEEKCSDPVEGLCWDYWNQDWKLENCTIVDSNPNNCNGTFVKIQCNASEVQSSFERSTRALTDIGEFQVDKCALIEESKTNGSVVYDVFNVTIVCGNKDLPVCKSVAMEYIIMAVVAGVFLLLIFACFLCIPIIGKRNVVYALRV
jgi:hypothetical protein